MPHDPIIDKFRQRLCKDGIVLTDQQCEQFVAFEHFLIEQNRKVNLTRITDRKEVYWKHFYDSLTLAFFVDIAKEQKVLDVGSGAGFPAIPLKIVYPHLEMTIVESLNKRLTFLRQLCDMLAVQGVHMIHGRAEQLGQDDRHREQYHLVTARAVARLNVLSEYCLPFTKSGGEFVALKTQRVAEELQEAEQALAVLGGKVKHVHTLQLPERYGERSIVRIHKERPTPHRFPRKPGKPSKQPL